MSSNYCRFLGYQQGAQWKMASEAAICCRAAVGAGIESQPEGPAWWFAVCGESSTRCGGSQLPLSKREAGLWNSIPLLTGRTSCGDFAGAGVGTVPVAFQTWGGDCVKGRRPWLSTVLLTTVNSVPLGRFIWTLFLLLLLTLFSHAKSVSRLLS